MAMFNSYVSLPEGNQHISLPYYQKVTNILTLFGGIKGVPNINCQKNGWIHSVSLKNNIELNIGIHWHVSIQEKISTAQNQGFIGFP